MLAKISPQVMKLLFAIKLGLPANDLLGWCWGGGEKEDMLIRDLIYQDTEGRDVPHQGQYHTHILIQS